MSGGRTWPGLDVSKKSAMLCKHCKGSHAATRVPACSSKGLPCMAAIEWLSHGVSTPTGTRFRNAQGVDRDTCEQEEDGDATGPTSRGQQVGDAGGGEESEGRRRRR